MNTLSKIIINNQTELINMIRKIVQEELSKVSHLDSSLTQTASEKEPNPPSSSINPSTDLSSTSRLVIGKPQLDPTRRFSRKKEVPKELPVIAQPYRPNLTHLETLPFSPSISLFL